MPAPNSCALARERLASFVARMREPGTLEKVTTGIKAGFLGQLVTPMKALGGNALSFGFRTLVEHPVRAGFDYLHAVGKSAADGRFTLSPDAYRQVTLALDKEGLGRIVQGFKKGAEPTRLALQTAGKESTLRGAITRFVDELNTRLDAEQVNRTLEYGRTTYKSPVLDNIVNGVMGVMEAVDRPYWRASHDFSLHMQSKIQAAAEGLKGESFKKRSEQLFENPTDEMILRAVDDANYVTFKNRNFLSRMAAGTKQFARQMAEKDPTAPKGTYAHGLEATRQAGAKGGSYVLETNLPFTGVPSAVAGQAFSLATGPLSLLRLVTNKNPAAVSRIVSDAALGSALIAWGYKLAREGNLTGAAPPSNTSERAQWDAEGRPPWSVRINGTWYDIRFLAPVAAPLYAGAGIAKARQAQPDVGMGKQLATAAGSTGQMLTQQTYLQNLSALIDALKAPDKKGARLAASQVPIPALSGQIARATDPAERVADGFWEQLQAKIPGLSRSLPERVDPLGRVQERTGVERLSEVFSPGRIKQSTENDITREFRRLGVNLSTLKDVSSVKGQKVERTGQEQAQFLKTLGNEKAQALGRFIASPEYQQLTDEQKANALRRIVGRLHDTANKRAVRLRTVPR